MTTSNRDRSHHDTTDTTRPKRDKTQKMRPFGAAIIMILCVFIVAGVVFGFIVNVQLVSNTSEPPRVLYSGQGQREGPPGINVINTTQPPHRLQKHHDKIMLVHIGKAAGETLKHHLHVTCSTRFSPQLRKACFREWNVTTMGINVTATSTIRQESEISKRTVAYLHCNLLHPSGKKNTALHNEITTNLFTIRSPIDRIFSWFHYIHPAGCNKKRDHNMNCIYKQQLLNGNKTIIKTFSSCFPTLQDFLSSLGPPVDARRNHGNDAMTTHDQHFHDDCIEAAHAILEAKTKNVRTLGHNYFNFNYYVNKRIQFEKRNVLAIRTEHFWTDFLQLDQLLGGQGKYQRLKGVIAFTHGAKTILPINMTVNTESIFYLCCELLSIGEIQIYWQILEHADNLNATTKQQSKMALLDQCGGGFQTLDDLQQKCQGTFSMSSY